MASKNATDVHSMVYKKKGKGFSVLLFSLIMHTQAFFSNGEIPCLSVSLVFVFCTLRQLPQSNTEHPEHFLLRPLGAA